MAGYVLLSLLLTCCLAIAQDILTVLNQQDDVSQFTDILTQNQDVVDQLNGGSHTCWLESLFVRDVY